MEKKKRLATKAQRNRIENMLLSGLIDRDEAQAIIIKSYATVDPALYWEQRFPGKGEELMNVLRPFYGWKPELKPALPDLEERAENARWSRKIKGARVFRASEADLLEFLSKDSFLHMLRETHKCVIDDLGHFGTDHLENSLRNSLRDLRGSLGDSLWGLLEDPLFFACGYILFDVTEAADWFKPLLELWLAGNFPVGFDDEGNLLVLVA